MSEYESGLRWAQKLAAGTAKKAAQHAQQFQRMRVVLYVRHDWGGNPFVFEHTTTTVSPLLAECEARKAAKAAGYIVWSHCDTIAE